MSESPTTQVSLLLRLGDADDREAWGRFVALYAPLIYRFFRRRSIQDADAADLTQEVLQVVSQRAKSFSHQGHSGSFRAWLYTIARNRMRQFLAQCGRTDQATGDSAVLKQAEATAAPEDDAQIWEQEHERRLFAWASQEVCRRVDPSTWQAFWQTAVEGQSGEQTAAALGLSPGAVYVAKSRVMARLRAVVAEIEASEGD
jgi:RNA polymerase sigma factor (sigma-70 family)